MKPKVLVVFGTRPELIKQAPLLPALKAGGLRVVSCATAQHRDLLDGAAKAFNVRPDHDLDLMLAGQTPAQVMTRVIDALTDRVLRREAPDLVVVQGDTTTALGSAFAAFYLGIPVAHSEAGLRSFDLSNPFPEEMNRVQIDRLSTLLFAPTAGAKRNLAREGLRGGVYVTGNTGIDALRWALRRPAKDPDALRGIPKWRRVVLVTLHRRESFGAPLDRIGSALLRLASDHPDTVFIYPVHPNPRVREQTASWKHPRLRLVEPLAYLPFLRLMRRASLFITDSGGLQEEAPTLGKPVFVLRETTERPEVIAMGAGKLLGTQAGRIVREVSRFLADPGLERRMRPRRNPFGDGFAARRIVAAVKHHFGLGPRPADWR